ncbi:MAG: glycine cleavage system protein GcvH [Hydrogenovibrio crunogenus]|uniref:Glycine cleavage system H protein n=1 Tax=Hydrogenovibrio crunogenus (strain DSM 25203 / XCL-2) TaxID=317025 RepID=GCSH_HYDCU|nr:RecName: Full=Glycine cleavage system H protein [Hydrogenovibrio crunogenus XCL-2]MBD3611223.1 glycine cleavage system protein GcvH [Hydrogenovibrio crunogenus]
MSVLPSHLKYADSHEWVYLDEEGHAVVGITDFAQESLGDLMDVHLPEVGADIDQGEEIMSLESVKAASDIFSPLSGEVVAVNTELEDEPERVNDEPYDGGWLFKLAPHDLSEMDDLLSDVDYQGLIDQS